MEKCFTAFGIALWLATEALAGAPPQSAAEFTRRGMQRFRENKIAESIQDFDKAAELDPQSAPHLWQRGISDYYAGKFKEGRKQFESHKTVNPDDVENAAWHFLCVARLDGIDAARKSLIAIDTARDPRVPMPEIYQFLAGRGSEAAVIKAAESNGDERALMYAHLYLGLFDEVAGQPHQARDHLRKAASAKLSKDYMHDVAKLHVLQRKWDR